MSGIGGYLGRALASRESAYFLNQSKHAVGNLKNKTKNTKPTTTTTTTSTDVLPEILQHSLPLNPPSYAPNHTTTNNPVATSRWNLGGGGGNTNSVSSKSLNPLRDYIALPQVTFGPNRWSLPQHEHEHEQALAATANQLRSGGSARDIDPQKLKAAAEGLAQVGKAFAIATIVVFGGATAALMLLVSKFQLSNSEDIKVEGKNILRPRIEKLQDQIAPLKCKVEKISTKWQIKPKVQTKESPFVKDLSKMFGRRTSK